MKRKLMFLIVLVAVAVCATSASPQRVLQDNSYLEKFREMPLDRLIPAVWLDVCDLNRVKYPDLNCIQPGDTILLPLGLFTIAQPGGGDHLWSAAQSFAHSKVAPFLGGYVVPDSPRVSPMNPTQSEPDEPEVTGKLQRLFPLLILLVIIAGVYAWWLSSRSRNSFVRRPPDFRQASDAAVTPVAESALQTALGRGVQIVGPVERGFINGEQVMFYANSSSRRETYVNEPGFRARVRFPNGQERTVVCRWACFNPCWSASDSSFRGTFLPQGAQTAQQIPAISNAGVDAVLRTISAGEGNVSPEMIPETDSAAAVSTVLPAAEGKMRLTKLQITDGKGVIIEGDFEISVGEVHDMLYQITGRRATDGKTKRGKSTQKPNPAS